MSCETALELMSAMLDGALTEEEAWALEAHLAECPSCKALMEALKGLDEKTAALAEPAPEGLKKGVQYRIAQATGAVKTPRRRWFGPGTAVGVVAAVLVLLVGTGVIPLGGLGAKQYAAEMPVETQSPALTQKSAWALPDGAQQISRSGAAEDGDDFYGQSMMEAPAAEPQPDSLLPGAESAVNALPVMTEASPDTVEEATEDSYYLSGGSRGSDPRPVEEETRSACAALSEAEGAAVLLYTEFAPETLFPLLEREAPALYELVGSLEPREEKGLLCYDTNCGAALALQEWLLENLPQSEEMDEDAREAETRLMIRMEELDPGSGSLYRVMTWTPRSAPVQWPEEWPAGWALRLRTLENWALFFPTEDYSPNPDKPALLVFPAD